MWQENLVNRFHGRTVSLNTHGLPLVPPGSRPISTATTLLNPAPEEEGEELPLDIPDSDLLTIPGTPALMPRTRVTSITSSIKKDDPPAVTMVLAKHASYHGHDMEANASSRRRSVRGYLMEELDTSQVAAPLTAYCFMTGFIDAVSFIALYVWCAFQTGNSVQLAIALTRLFNGDNDLTFHVADRQALCSVVSFILGAFLGRAGDKVGCKTRLWMTFGTFLQSLFTMGASILIWQSREGSVAAERGEPAWTNVLSYVGLGLISASMGLQGIMGKRLNTHFTTTVVLTTTWCELVTEPQLFNLRRLVTSRDHKVIAILFLFLGGFAGSALLDKLGDTLTLAIAAGIRFVIALSFLFIPPKPRKSSGKS